jgi:trans-aconitate methyltransferase
MDLREARARQIIVRHPWELARLEVVDQIIKDHFNAKNELTILDVGCGDTFFVEQLSERYNNSRFFAIDIEFQEDDVAALNAKFSQKPIHIFTTLEEMEQQQAPKSVDIILLLDVIEHIEEDVAFLKMLLSKPYVTPKTKFFITVPAFQGLFMSHDVFLGHYRRYSNRTLNLAIQKANLQSKDIGYFFSSLLPIRALQTLKERLFGQKENATGLVTWNGSDTSALWMKKILITDYQIFRLFKKIGIKLPGLSNYVVASRK